MKSRNFGAWGVVLGLIAGSFTTVWAALPVTNTVTYQGQLKDNGVPVDGVYDFEFQLFDALMAGGSASAVVPKPNVMVANGLFTVELDFGAAAFTGEARWLGIKAKADAVGVFSPLSPRQPLNAAPYALYALNAPGGGGTLDQAYDFGGAGAGRTITADTGAVNIAGTGGLTVSGDVGFGTISPLWDLHVHRSQGPLVPVGTPIRTVLGVQNNITNGIGGPTSVRWGFLQVSTDNTWVRNATADVHFATEPALNAGPLTNQMSLTSAGNLGIGTTTPDVKLHIEGGTDTGPGGGGFLVMGSTTSTNISIDNNEIMARNNGAVANLALNGLGGNVTLIQNGSGNVGVGTSAPVVKLHVEGGADASPGGGGYLVTGSTPSTNISIDDNEIMARNNGATSTLYINNNGGDVVFGGAIDIGYQRVTTSALTAGTTAYCPIGKRVLGGGCSCTGLASVYESYPNQTSNGWTCVCSFLGVEAFAICAQVK